MASASCSALRTERSNILRRITCCQPTITRLLGKMSVIPLRIQTKMPDRCMEERLERERRPPLVEKESLRAQAVPKAQEIGLHPVRVGSQGKGKGNPCGALLQARTRGLAAVEVPHPAAVAV